MARKPSFVAVAFLLLVAGSTTAARAGHDEFPGSIDRTVGPLVSGTASYVDGTFVWTDYAYDDKGPNMNNSPGGNATYPGPTSNAADLIQLQFSLTSQGDLRIRAILETLTDVGVPFLGAGFDTDLDSATGGATAPGGSWTVTQPLGLDRFVTVSSSGGNVLGWSGSSWETTASFPATIESTSNSMTTVVPRSVLDPGTARWAAVGALGLAGSSSWLTGDGPIYDLAFVRAEDPCPMPGETGPCISNPDNRWQDIRQADVLAGRLSATEAVVEVDFGRIARRDTELARPDTRGYHTLLYYSHLNLGQGIRSIEGESAFHAGPYQPYLVRVPAPTGEPLPMIVYLHGGGGNHLQGAVYNFASFEPAALLVFPLGRGPNLGYGGTSALGNLRPTNAYGEQDVLDVLDDVSSRFDVDTGRVVVSGISNGGIGAVHFAEFHPDRFTGVLPIVSGDYGIVPINHFRPGLLQNLINVRVRMANGAIDPLANIAASEDMAVAMDLLGDVDYRSFLALRRHHEWQAGLVDCVFTELVGQESPVNPPRVVYTVNPAFDVEFPASGLSVRHTGAYWVSELRVRDQEARNRTVAGFEVEHSSNATIDVTTLARAVRTADGAPVAGAGQNVTTAADYCGNPSAQSNDAWRMRGVALTPGNEQETANGMRLTLSNFDHAALDLSRMDISVREPISVSVAGDGQTTLSLRGPWRSGTDVRVARDGVEAETLVAESGVLRLTGDFTGTHELVLTPAVSELLDIVIEVRPREEDDTVNLKSQGRVPVALLSDGDFDATSVDADTLTFGRTGDEDSLARRGKSQVPACDSEDTNGDRLLDLVCEFHVQATGFEQGDTEAVLRGRTAGGQAIEGRGAITTT